MGFVANFIHFPAMQEMSKSVKIWQSYREYKGEIFFETRCSIDISLKRKYSTDVKTIETIAIYNVLPFKAPARLLAFWGYGTQQLKFDGFIYIHCAAAPYSAGLVVISFVEDEHKCQSYCFRIWLH